MAVDGNKTNLDLIEASIPVDQTEGRGLSIVKKVPLAWWALMMLVGATAIISPHILMPFNLSHLIRQAVPGAVVALGETFVILAGGFDLSIASTVSLIAAVASGEMAGKAENILPTVALCLSIGTVIGVTNGLIVSVYLSLDESAQDWDDEAFMSREFIPSSTNEEKFTFMLPSIGGSWRVGCLASAAAEDYTVDMNFRERTA